MTERDARSYLKGLLDEKVVSVETRGTIINPGEPQAIVWVGLDDRPSMRKILPILINPYIDDDLSSTIRVYKHFAGGEIDGDRIVSPIYTTEPNRPAQEFESDPRYEFQSVSTDRPEIYSSEYSGIQEFASDFAAEAERSGRVNMKIGTPNRGYVPLIVSVRAPGAIFKTQVPFFVGEPSNDDFHSAIQKMTIPCIAVSRSEGSSDQASFSTNVLLPFVN